MIHEMPPLLLLLLLLLLIIMVVIIIIYYPVSMLLNGDGYENPTQGETLILDSIRLKWKGPKHSFPLNLDDKTKTICKELEHQKLP